MELNFKKGAFVASLFFFLACQTTPVNDFAKIKNGMTKDDVLDTLGSPSRTERIDGKEKWAYRYWTGDDHSIETLRQVTFLNNNVVAFGEDAEEEQRRIEIQREDAARVERRSKALALPVKGAPAPVAPTENMSAPGRPAIEEDFVEVKGKKQPAKDSEN